MDLITASEIQAEAVSVLTGMLPMLDSADPSYLALKLVSINFVLCFLFSFENYGKNSSNAKQPPGQLPCPRC